MTIQQQLDRIIELDALALSGPWRADHKYQAVQHVQTELLILKSTSAFRANDFTREAVAEFRTFATKAARALKIAIEVFDMLEAAPELNPSNYSHDEACELNAAIISATLLARTATKELES